MSMNNAELLYVLDELGVGEYINIYDNPEEVQQLCNKIGRPELFQACIDEVNNMIQDNNYEPETSESDSECSDSDIVEEDYIINPSNNGFCELVDVYVKKEG